MGNEKEIKPPIAATIYGEITRWVIIIGLIIAVIGSVIYFGFGGYLDKDVLITDLWKSTDYLTLWKACASDGAAFQSGWYLAWLPRGDAIAMLGIAIACLAGVIGMWGAFWGTVRSKSGIYIAMALVTSTLLTLSALGILKINL